MTEVELQAIEERLEMVDEFKDNWEQLATQDVFALLTHIRAVEADNSRLRDALKAIVDCHGVGWSSALRFVMAIEPLIVDAQDVLQQEKVDQP